MNENQTTTSRLVELVQRAELARNQEIIADAMAATLPDKQAEAETDWQALIGNEAVELYNRMRFLARHPRLPRFLGGSAIKISKIDSPFLHNIFTTGPLLGTEPELAGDAAIGNHVELTAKIYRRRWEACSSWTESSKLDVYSVSSEINTGTRAEDRIYTTWVETWKGKAFPSSFKEIRGPSFDAYRFNACRERYEEFKQEHPLLEKFMVFKDEGSWISIPDSGGTSVSLREQNQANDLVDELNNLESNIRYPDELYHFPLGILMHANRALREK